VLIVSRAVDNSIRTEDETFYRNFYMDRIFPYKLKGVIGRPSMAINLTVDRWVEKMKSLEFGAFR